MSAGAGIGMGTSFIGSDIQGWAALFDKWAMQKAYENEARTQTGYQQQALGGPIQTGINQSTLQAAQQMMGQGKQARESAYGAIAPVPLGGGFSAQSNYNPSAADAYTNMMGGLRANLGSYSDWAFQQSINNLRNQQALNQISNFAGGESRNVFPLNMYAAQHKYDWLSSLGQMIAAAGGAAGAGMQLSQQPPTVTGGVQQYQNAIGPTSQMVPGQQYQFPTGPPQTVFGLYNPYTDQSSMGYGAGMGWTSG